MSTAALYGEYRPDQPVRGGVLKQRTLPGTYQLPVARRWTTPDRAQSWSFFHPGRCDVRFGPDWFRDQLRAIDPNLDVTWHPVHERWCVWVRNPRITHPMCPGWQLLFPVQYPSGRYLPLDERTIAKVYDRSPRKWGNARIYFDRIEDEILRDRLKVETARKEEVAQSARDHWDFAQIKISMAGPSSGSKFATHHAGD